MATRSVHHRGISVGTPVPRTDREVPANNEVVTYQLSPEELERYRRMGKPRDKPPVGLLKPEQIAKIEEANGMGTMTLTKEEYLAKRVAGMSRAQIAKELGISAPTLVYHLGKWGLKEAGTEQEAIAQLRQRVEPVEAPAPIEVAVQVTKEAYLKTEDTNTSSPQTYTQVVDNSETSEASEELEYITVRIPLRFDGYPPQESGKVGFNRNELIENGVKSLQSAAAWAYKEMLELLDDEATIQRVESFMQRKIGAH